MDHFWPQGRFIIPWEERESQKIRCKSASWKDQIHDIKNIFLNHPPASHGGIWWHNDRLGGTGELRITVVMHEWSIEHNKYCHFILAALYWIITVNKSINVTVTAVFAWITDRSLFLLKVLGIIQSRLVLSFIGRRDAFLVFVCGVYGPILA